MEIQPIARIRSCFGGKFSVPRQPGLCPSAWGELVFEPGYRQVEALRGLEGFSHIWLIFGFHLIHGEAGWNPTVRPPRLGGNERLGVFATRSTHRPNGLGLSLVRLAGMEDRGATGVVLHLRGIDLCDDTPIYDIKPYLPYAESLPDARGGFAAEEPKRLDVIVDASGFADLPERSQRVIVEALSLDPRPQAGRAEAGRIHGAGLCGVEVKFSVEGNSCRILSVETASGSGLNG